MKQTKKHRKTFLVRAPWQDNVLSLAAILSLLLLTLMAVVCVFRLLSFSGLLSRGILTQPPPEETMDTDAPSVYDKLLSESGDVSDQREHIVAFSGDFSVLRELLCDETTADDYYAEYETVLYTGTTESRTAIRIYVSGRRFRIERNPNGFSATTPSEFYICDGTDIAYTDTATGTTRRFSVSDNFDMASLAGIPSVASFTKTDLNATTDVTYTEINGEMTYHITFRIPVDDNTFIPQEYWISPTEELVLHCKTFAIATDATAANARVLYSFSRKATRPLTEREKTNLFRMPVIP